ncbi:hypothetical protein H6F67_21610 [Microcoleus sp. FACHB-1515]|uniref:hypothetical protein n=1 Tax=Cyanophyceae TaxID=3028117 RepID=UPI0016836F03|nr:hypothetical protein [Microcoleus sp. FACHB-1515]MBD2092448.1 hypothetical protein [Microcoleus sp. FACHB-1515]
MTLTRQARSIAPFITVGLVVLGVVAIVLLQLPLLRQIQAASETPNPAQIQRDTIIQTARLNLLEKAPTFGFDNLVADWTFLSFLQYFGDQPARLATDYRLSPEFFDVVIDRDPRFLQTYPFLSSSTALFAAQPERSIALMNQGLQSMTPTIPPGSFYVWRNKAIDELLFLGDAQAARQSFLKAAEWARASGLPEAENVARLSEQTAQTLDRNPDSRQAQIGAWVLVLGSAPDDRTRQTAIDRIQQLGGQIVPQPDGSFSVQLPPD